MRFSHCILISLAALEGCAPQESKQTTRAVAPRHGNRRINSGDRTPPIQRLGPGNSLKPDIEPEKVPEPIKPTVPRAKPVVQIFSVQAADIEGTKAALADIDRRITAGTRPPGIDNSGLRCGATETLADKTLTITGSSLSDERFDYSNVLPATIEDKDGEFAIKYRLNCEEGQRGRNEDHPAVRNYKFMRLVNNLFPDGKDDKKAMLTPAAYHFSAPFAFVPAGSTKGINIPDPAACETSEIRFVVMQAAGISLASLVERSGHLDVQEALAVGLSVVRKLQKLHSKGIIHGDIQWHNVLIHSPEKISDDYFPTPFDDLVLVDWDRSIISGQAQVDDIMGLSTQLLWSPAEIMDDVPATTYANDLFRVYDMMALLMGRKYDPRLTEAELLQAKGESVFMGKLPANAQEPNVTAFNEAARELHKIVMDLFAAGVAADRVPDLNRVEMLIVSMMEINSDIEMDLIKN